MTLCKSNVKRDQYILNALCGSRRCLSEKDGHHMLRYPQFKPVLAVGHRGAHLLAPENTIPSFKKAIELGADIIEIDVRYTRDGHFVIFHDDTVTRLTGQDGAIEERTLAEVQRLTIQLAEFAFLLNCKILTLKDAVSCLQGPVLLYLDHKTGPTARLAEEVVRLGAIDYAYIVVRTLQGAREARAVSPELHLMAAITAEEPSSLIDDFFAIRPALFELPQSRLTRENVETLHERQIQVFTNAMDTEKQEPYVTYRKLLYGGADIIQTDYLDQLVPFLRDFNAARFLRLDD